MGTARPVLSEVHFYFSTKIRLVLCVMSVEQDAHLLTDGQCVSAGGCPGVCSSAPRSSACRRESSQAAAAELQTSSNGSSGGCDVYSDGSCVWAVQCNRVAPVYKWNRPAGTRSRRAMRLSRKLRSEQTTSRDFTFFVDDTGRLRITISCADNSSDTDL